MLMTLSFGGVIAITPFAIIRLINDQLIIGLVDTTMIVGMAILGSYVYITRKIKFASITLTCFSLIGMIAVVHLKGPDVVYWVYPTMVGVYFILAPHLAIKLTLLSAFAISPALYDKMETMTFIAVFMTLIVNNVFAYVFANRMKHQQEQMTLLIRKDPLTGAGNRRALDEKLDEILAINKRIEQTASLIVLDVDHFKSINDNYGHAIGDQVLIKLVETLKYHIRATDCIYRFGGEEFVIILTGTAQNDASKMAEIFREMIESTNLIMDMKVTISLGVAELIKTETGEDWVERADKLMYQAKESGRNRVCVA